MIVQTLLHDGAVRIPSYLHKDCASNIRAACLAMCAENPILDSRMNSVSSSVLPDNPEILPLIRASAYILEKHGLGPVKFLAGFIVPKVLDEPRRDWHVDSWLWENPDVNRTIPPQVGILTYLDDAGVNSGRPLVIPGSHRREVYGHLSFMETKMPHPCEVGFTMSAGDALLLDARVTHGSAHNVISENRICLTLWFMLAFDNLSEQTRATTRYSTVPPNYKDCLGDLYPEYTGNLKPELHVKQAQFPITLRRIDALRHNLNDAAILKDIRSSEDSWIDKYDIYSWYRAIGCAKAPQRILEMGVRYGYAGYAMAMGAQWAGIDNLCYVGVDSEYDQIPSNSTAMENIKRLTDDATVLKISTLSPDEVTRAIASLPRSNSFDIVHVDADHSEDGIQRELALAKFWVKPDGLILVDDIDIPHVKKFTENFCLKYGIVPLHIPTMHGLFIINMKSRTLF